MSKLTFSAPVELTAAKDEKSHPTFEMVAYTGVPINVSAFYSPVIVELSGVKTSNPAIPILLDHDASKLLGHVGRRAWRWQEWRPSAQVLPMKKEAAHG